ncbi:MAG: SpoIID/LytB domain-containing protein [Elusimicrobiota bacterium]
MRFFRLATRVLFAAVFSFCALAADRRPLAPAMSPPPSPADFIISGHRLYYEGRPGEAVAAYREALRRDARSLEAWVNGAVVWGDLADADREARWYRKAAGLAPGDPHVRTALAEAELRRGRHSAARLELERVLAAHPREPHALIARGRVELASGRPKAAIVWLRKAAESAPETTQAHFWLGRAYAAAGDRSRAVEAYRKAALGDSYFTSARYALARELTRDKRYHEASAHLGRLVNAAPANKTFRRLARTVRAGLDAGGGYRNSLAAPGAREAARSAKPLPMMPPPSGKVPGLRVGVGTTGMGKPLAWNGVLFSATTRFTVRDAGSGKRLASGNAGERWEIRLIEKERPGMELLDAGGRRVLRTRRPIIIRPRVRRGGTTYIREPWRGSSQGDPRLARVLRGEIELSPYLSGLKIVNVIDLESYTHGVLTAEMPVDSPMEALKTQAVLARTHALFIGSVRRRHKRDGFDLCDGQHCQVYSGVQAETARSRAVVNATRGRVVTYRGRIANVLYSSNCGGHTQSAGDIQGWGDVPYFHGVSDAPTSVSVPAPVSVPASPWRLRRSLRGAPPAYCRASSHVSPAHFRWTRVVPAAELEARLDRHLGIGRLRGILPLRRARSGHLGSILVRGSRSSREITSEIQIRGLFGIGSQRSSLFVVDTELDAEGRPETFTFYGGGWGHGVGLCQSGAMGRAERGHSYAEILRAYYRDTEVGDLRY